MKEFNKYVGALRKIDQEYVKSILLKGLKEEIQIKVRSFEIHTLAEIIQKSLMIEQELKNSVIAVTAVTESVGGCPSPIVETFINKERKCKHMMKVAEDEGAAAKVQSSKKSKKAEGVKGSNIEDLTESIHSSKNSKKEEVHKNGVYFLVLV